MAVLITIIVFVLIGAVVLVVGAPLRAARARGPAQDAPPDGRAREARLAELGAAREAKYREIRDAEMDYRTGKLSEQDYRALDAELRGEALTVLDALRELGEEPDDEDPAGGG